MAERTPLRLNAAELEFRLDALLREWSAHAAATPLATDQRLQIRARLRQLQQSDASAPLDIAAVLGPLVCKSPQTLSAFREFCSTDAGLTRQIIPSPESQTPDTHPAETAQPPADIKKLQRKLWMLAISLISIGAVVVTLLAGWSEWRQKLCGWDFWGQHFCESVVAPDLPPATPVKTNVPASRDNPALVPIIEPVTTAVRQPPLRLVRADLDPPDSGAFEAVPGYGCHP